MNSYNENLNATVVASLQSLDLEEKSLKSQLNASMFTLYHAEGATITAQEKLELAVTDMNAKSRVKNIAVINTNTSNNLLSSATQADQYIKQAVTNAAVGASNVQVAANSIIKLASDVGSIYSIVNAADFDTDIFHQAENVRDLMNDTAYNAEIASQLAMDSSKLIASVSSSTVLDQAKSTNAAIKNILKITSADFDTASQTVSADNATQASVSAAEKVAEGTLEDICVDYISSKVAYASTNRDLNLNLRVNAKSSTLFFTVTFDLIKSPFGMDDPKRPLYPVENYYVFVVKETKKLTFSMSSAETAVLGYPHQLVQYTPPPAVHAVESAILPNSNGLVLSGDEITGPIYYSRMLDKDAKDAADKIYTLLDSDGDPIKPGVDYVVFVMATYYSDYKKLLNNFDDFLSAPSKSFCLKNKLRPADPKKIKVDVINDTTIKLEDNFTNNLAKATKNEISTSDSSQISPYTQQLTFDITEHADYAEHVEYRCMFLPVDQQLTKGFLTKASLKTLIDVEVLGLKSVEEQYDPQIEDRESELAELEYTKQQATEELQTIDNKIAAFTKSHPTPNADQKKELAQMKTEQKAAQTKLSSLTKDITAKQAELVNIKKLKDDSLQGMVAQSHNDSGFFFNLALAEQVSAGNYIPAISFDLDDDKDKPKTSPGSSLPAPDLVTSNWIAFIGPDTTDNFGNLLITGNSYIPVVLSLTTVSETQLGSYKNALSDFENTKSFTYGLKNNGL